jgi:hypothetical protein
MPVLAGCGESARRPAEFSVHYIHVPGSRRVQRSPGGAALNPHVVTDTRRLLALLPHRVTGAVVAGLFLAGSAYLWVASFRPERREGTDAARQGGRPANAGAGPVAGLENFLSDG